MTLKKNEKITKVSNLKEFKLCVIRKIRAIKKKFRYSRTMRSGNCLCKKQIYTWINLSQMSISRLWKLAKLKQIKKKKKQLTSDNNSGSLCHYCQDCPHTPTLISVSMVFPSVLTMETRSFPGKVSWLILFERVESPAPMILLINGANAIGNKYSFR